MPTVNRCPLHLVDQSTGKPFEPESFPLRSDIPAPPERMAHLPVDERGYPVPRFVAWVNGKPEFRGAMREYATLCVRHQLCWVCGQRLNATRAFVIGPMCAVNRISAEPPSHLDCARYSAIACPFLSKPQMIRRENDMPVGKLPMPGIALLRNPGVTMLWFCRGARDYGLLNEPQGLLFHFLREPVGVEWFCRGRQATRDEVIESIHSGLPLLKEHAMKDGLIHLVDGWVKRAMRLVPSAPLGKVTDKRDT